MNETHLKIEMPKKITRQQKLEKLKASGINVYPYSYKPDYTIQEVLEKADSLIQTEQPESAKKFSLAGRILGIRGQGKTTFIDLWDCSFSLATLARRKNFKSLTSKKTMIGRLHRSHRRAF